MIAVLETADLAYARATALTARAGTRPQAAYAAEQHAHAARVRAAADIAQLCYQYVYGR